MVVEINSGLRSGATMTGSDAHPMVAITARLSGGFVERGADLARSIGRITADIRRGPALHEGETVLAALYSRYLPGHRSRGDHAALALTDRRVYGEIANDSVPQSFFDVPLSHVTDVREEGVLGASARVMLGPRSLIVPVFGKDLVRHLRAVLALPPAARTMGPLPVVPAAGDPIGAHAAFSLLASSDARTRALPPVVFELARRGQLHEQSARALLERIVILDRSLVMGRAMHHGQWLSTLPRPALRSTLCASLGEPEGSSVGPGWELHDFAIERSMDRRAVALTAAATLHAAGLASAMSLGVRLLARAAAGFGVDRMRVTLRDVPCGSSFELRSVTERGDLPLPFATTGLLEALFASVARVELRGLLSEIAFSGRVPPEQQPAVPQHDLESALASVGVTARLQDLYSE